MTDGEEASHANMEISILAVTDIIRVIISFSFELIYILIKLIDTKKIKMDDKKKKKKKNSWQPL